MTTPPKLSGQEVFGPSPFPLHFDGKQRALSSGSIKRYKTPSLARAEHRTQKRLEQTWVRPGLSNAPYLPATVPEGVQGEASPCAVGSLGVRYQMRPGTLRVSLRGTYTKMPPGQGAKRGTVREFSPKSKANLREFCREQEALSQIPQFMITLTYPGNFAAYCPNGKVLKNHLQTFKKRFERKYGSNYKALWIPEFQKRGAPHLHLIYWGCEGISWLEVSNPDSVLNWAKKAWAEIVADGKTPDPLHKNAGTSVQPMRKKHWGYALKEVAKHEQKRIPSQFKQIGRMWGYWHVKRSPWLSVFIDLLDGAKTALEGAKQAIDALGPSAKNLRALRLGGLRDL